METIVISGVNLVNGGPFTIIKNCLDSISRSDIPLSYNIVALVHRRSLFPPYNNIKLVEFPKAKAHYIYRIYYEYFVFKFISNRLKPKVWLSLHDMSPFVSADIQAVYMHNASIFLNVPRKFSSEIVFSSLYKLVYRINIHSNNYLIVQQNWLRDSFSVMFNFSKKKIVVARPEQENKFTIPNGKVEKKGKFVFVYPSFPRSFKNFEIICEAVKYLNADKIKNFEVKLTLDGSENKYAATIVERYDKQPNIKFVGLIKPERMGEFYFYSDCLIFPSKLESWGLPISEYKQFGKPMILADLPYAHETSSDSEKIAYVNPDNARELADRMREIIVGNTDRFKVQPSMNLEKPFTNSWVELINLLLDEK